MSERKLEARKRYMRGETPRAIAKLVDAEEGIVKRWVEEGGWDVVRRAVVLELSALRATEAEAADERYAAISDAIRAMASTMALKAKEGKAKASDLLALSKTVESALKIRDAVERRRADRKHRRE